MSFSDVIRNITRTVTNKDELKEKAKDLPLLVVQTTLSAAGQALLLVDRVKNSIKGLGGKERQEEYDSRPSAADQVATAPPEAKADEKGEEDKPARREPVIFAPRPGSAEPNGVAKTKPDPVIFAPASKTENAPESAPKADTTTATVTDPKPTVTEEAEPKSAPKAEPKAEPAPVAEAPTTEAPAAEAPETKAAKVTAPAAEAAPVAEPKADVTEQAEPKAAVTEQAEPVTAPAPVAEAPAAEAKPATTAKATKPAKPAKATKPVAAQAPAAEVSAAGELAEPLPGFSGLTVASLRARMRGKTAEQIGDYLAYEQATTARPEVIRMFENRLAKLQAGE
ncbi:hypothetical protein [Nonomuraea jiangxiensis]|uniref:Meckel syndrome type 1 protein n=1 Tax=Nonomuraea jiangxiensis TaxID=633440 RepID=A0A1G8NNK1_9ACTN|nr:hypothetical protein [Nonomuraea jiangxiensis]SDI81080.1 hypothetical protein SAMN05421869_107159 [Nonomuraea jiangxiensis]